jgi:hypothetical protein
MKFGKTLIFIVVMLVAAAFVYFVLARIVPAV